MSAIAPDQHRSEVQRILFERLFDYAGMFPPASLPLRAAAEQYLQYRQSPADWMLASLIVPGSQLETLANWLQRLEEPDLAALPMPIALLGEGGGSDVWLDVVERELAAAGDLLAACGDRVAIAAIELRLPEDLMAEAKTDTTPLLYLAEAAVRSVRRAGLGTAALFIEPPRSAATELGWYAALELTATLAEEQLAMEPRVGLKLRTGGLDAAAIPSPAQVRNFIRVCHAHRVPWKATAGLHHPLRGAYDGSQTAMHGFVNVLLAAALVAAEAAPADVEAVLQETDPLQFSLDDAGFRWRDTTLTHEQLRSGRERLISIGSCSFDEPRGDLARLGWLPS